MAYRDEGRGTPIILIHGWGVSGELFDAQMNGLSDRFRVVAPDLRGHGASDGFPDDAPFSIFADGIAALAAELGLENSILVGWSMGAMVAWDLLVNRNHQGIAGLVTIDMAPHVLNQPGWPNGLRNTDDSRVIERNVASMLRDWPAYTNLFVPRIFSQIHSAGAETKLNWVRNIALENNPVDMAKVWSRLVQQDFRDDLPRISNPVLVVSGQNSQLYGSTTGEWVASQIPGSKLKTFSQSGHAPHVEEPDHFNRILSEFVDGISATNRSAQAGIEQL